MSLTTEMQQKIFESLDDGYGQVKFFQDSVIQLDNDNGKYIHNIPELISEKEQYFLPIELSKLTIQLYSENNELYSCNNSDNSFEFEIIMVKNKDLLK